MCEVITKAAGSRRRDSPGFTACAVPAALPTWQHLMKAARQQTHSFLASGTLIDLLISVNININTNNEQLTVYLEVPEHTLYLVVLEKKTEKGWRFLESNIKPVLLLMNWMLRFLTWLETWCLRVTNTRSFRLLTWLLLMLADTINEFNIKLLCVPLVMRGSC